MMYISPVSSIIANGDYMEKISLKCLHYKDYKNVFFFIIKEEKEYLFSHIYEQSQFFFVTVVSSLSYITKNK